MEFDKSLSPIDCYLAELDWRILHICEGIWDILDDLEEYKEMLEYDGFPRPPAEFGQLQT